MEGNDCFRFYDGANCFNIASKNLNRKFIGIEKR